MATTGTATLCLADIERRICDLTAKQLGFPRAEVTPSSRLREDLACDSLDFINLIMEIEESFDVSMPAFDSPEPVYKAVFTRQPCRLSDLAEAVYLVQGSGKPDHRPWRRDRRQPPSSVPFTHLTGTWDGAAWDSSTSGGRLLFDSLTDWRSRPLGQFRRRSDGMRCMFLPSAAVEIGCDGPDALADEGPVHVAELDAFLIDAEPVSTTAYCRFLNSVAEDDPDVLTDWFVLDPRDDRNAHAVVTREADGWRPVAGMERCPMILVSWHGANAYSLWANGHDWRDYRDEGDDARGSFLPTEAQWEYAARGARYRRFPWGDAAPEPERLCYGRHCRGETYRADTLPMAAVNERLGMSPFGLHHMAGNVWQWCRDWYDRAYYRETSARGPNPWNRTPSGVRSERGGSWVGPADLCRSSFRRGRPPAIRGRCLGFRCVSDPREVRNIEPISV